MDRPAQLVCEGSRTLLEFDVTIEIVVIHLFKYGLFEVLTREESSQCELRPIYLRACIIQQRVKPVEVDQLITSSRLRFDPKQSLNDDEVFDLAVRASIFDYIADRLSLKRKMASFSGMYYEVYFTPAMYDLEFGADKRRLDQLVCQDPYYFGHPPPYKEILPEAKELDLQEDPLSSSKAPSTRTKSGSVLRRLSSFFAPFVSTASERSLQTESATVCGSWSQASAEHRPDDESVHSVHSGTHSSKQNLAHRILNRLKKLPDISEGPSGVEHPVPSTAQDSSHKLATSDNMAAYFTASSRQPGEHAQNPRAMSPPRCVANIPQHVHDSPFPGSEFYDDVASGNIHPKPTADSPDISRLDHNSCVNDSAAGQVLGGAMHRSSRVGIA